MNYYRRYVGDYLRDTPRLSVLEHGAYNLLLDYYYADEQPLPVDRLEVYTMVRAMTPADRKAVDKVLDKYFELKDDGWHNKRADHEIEVSQKARDNGKKGGRGGTGDDTGGTTGNGNPVGSPPMKNGTGQATGTVTGDGGGTVHPPTTNHQPPPASPQPPATNHQESKAKARAKKPALRVSFPPWAEGDEAVKAAWQEYVDMRTLKRKPMTEKAITRLWQNLSGWRVDGHDPKEILLKSARCGWTDLYEPKPDAPRETNDVTEANRLAASEFVERGNPAVAET